MRFLSTRSFIAMGLAMLTLSLLMGASWLGLLPDRSAAVRDGRIAVAELLAASATRDVLREDTPALQASLDFLVDRQPDLLSVAIRAQDGTVVASAGEHTPWQAMPQDTSTDEQMQVSLATSEGRWGQAELRWRPVAPSVLGGLLPLPWLWFGLWMLGAGFFAFHVYLGRVLKQLDPSQAVPARVRSALDTLAEGLLVVDKKLNVALANRAFAALLGVEAESLTGRAVGAFGWRDAHGKRLPDDAPPWHTALREGTVPPAAMLYLKDKTGALRSFSVRCAPVMAGSRPGGVLVSLDDVTQLEAHKAALAQARDEAEAANRSKSEFLANMSHEIRTPMNAVLGFTELLRRGFGRNEAESRRYLDTIHSSGKHLLELINDILDLSKVEAGRMEVERTECAVHRIIQEVVVVLGVRAREKGIGLDFTVERPVPAQVQSDPARVRQIVTNLVGNAIKFTERGGVRIVLRLAGSPSQPRLEIDVIDSGIGIAQDKLESVFDPFVQADTSVTRRFGGTGLGLAISRKFARALGGDIKASSVAGRGSTFRVTLDPGSLLGQPLLAPEAALADCQSEQQQDATAWTFPPATVLVVDDGPENRELVALVLRECGLTVLEAENGLQGRDMTLTRRPDVVLMDMQMPVMDGFTATRQLRERNVRTPIIALTAHAMKGFEEQIRAAGCSGYLTKPVDIDGLIRTLAELLGGKPVTPDQTAVAGAAGGANAAGRTEPVPPPMTTAPTRAALTEACDAAMPLTAHSGDLGADHGDDADETDDPIVSRLADNARLRPVVAKFATRLHEQLHEMDVELQAGNLAELAALAHWLKGSGGTVGYDAFTEPARALEAAAKAEDAASCRALLERLHRMEARVVSPDGTTARQGEAIAA